MSIVRFDGESNSPKLERITAKKNYASSSHSHKMGATYMFDAIHKRLSQELYPDLANEANSSVAVKQLPVYGFEKVLKEGTKDQYNHYYIGNYTVGADKGDKNYFGYKIPEIAAEALRLEGLDHVIGAGFDYPWDIVETTVNSDTGEISTTIVENIVYYENEELKYRTSSSTQSTLEFSFIPKEISDVSAYIDEEFKPAYLCAYRANPLIAGTTLSIDEINADVISFRKLRRSDDRAFSDCEIWIDGEYDLYYYNQERKQYEKTGVNLRQELNEEERALLDSKSDIEEKNKIFIDFRINRFKGEVDNYWCVNDAIYQLVFLYIIAASDNFKKNMYPYKLRKFANGGRYRFYQDDLDSIFATDNQGQDTKSYSVELHDFTSGSKDAYVFKGESNTLFQALELAFPERIKKMGYDILTTMIELSSSGKTTLEKLMGFFDDFFFSRAQEYFTKSAYNSDAEYSYEEAWNNKAYVASVNIHPLAQSLGDHYSATKAWLEKRMVFLMSKYGVGGFKVNNYSETSLGSISMRLQNQTNFTLTPAIDLFPTILGGQSGSSISTERTKAGTSVTLTTPDVENTNTYIVGTDYLSDIGDLKDLIVDPASDQAFSVSSKRLRKLKLGDAVGGDLVTVNDGEKEYSYYSNVTNKLATLSIYDCPSLEDVDVRHLISLTSEIDLTGCPRLQNAWLSNTKVPKVKIASGSKIKTLDLPESITDIRLIDTKYLNNFSYSTLSNLTHLRMENTPTLNAFQVLKTAFNSENQKLRNIRLVGWNYDGTADDLTMLSKIIKNQNSDGSEHEFGYGGMDNAGEDSGNIPFLQGTLNISGGVYVDDINTVKGAYGDRLSINYDENKLYIPFKDAEVKKVLLEKGVGDGTGITTAQAAAVTSIGTWFKGNTTIETFEEFEKFIGVTSISGSWYTGAFDGCTSLETINLPESITSLGAACFNGCSGLKSITLPDAITYIGDSAFKNCSQLVIDGLKLPNLKAVGAEYTFMNTLLSGELNLPSLSSVGMSSFAYTQISSVTSLGSLTTLPDSPNDGHGLFLSCTQLKSVVLPSTLTKIGQRSFMKCTALETIISDWVNITSIGGYAFYNCTSLSFEELNLPNLTSLGQNAFYGVKIKKMNLGALVTLPAATTSSQTYGDKSVLEEVILSENVKSIPSNSFFGYTKMKTINLQNVVEFGSSSLKNSGLQELNNTIVESIGGAAFAESAIERVVLGDKLSTLPNTNYTTAAFRRCSKLEHFEIDSQLDTLGASTFEACPSLKTVILRGCITPPSIFNSTFLTTNSTFLIYVPDASVEAYKAASGWIDYADRIYPMNIYESGGVASIIEFEDPAVEAICLANWDNNKDGYFTKAEAASVTTILGKFSNNTEMTSFNELRYFTSLKEIGDACFNQCTSLQYLIIPSNVTRLGWRCFNSCSALKQLVLLREDAIIPALSNSLSGMVISEAIYVPDSLVESYKQADYWSAYADKFKPLSEYVES